MLPIDESTLDNDGWYYHHSKPVKVNESGTHVYHLKKRKFLNIRLFEWKICDWKKLQLSVDGKPLSFDRLALECFIGRDLLPGETCEHIDCDRTNNSADNLLPRYRLFQANARKIHKFEVHGKENGVCKRPDGRGWTVSVRMYTPDSVTASVELRKHFWNNHYGGSEEAEKEAVAFHRKHTLRDGMIYV
jgi:hypothetical protein